MHLFRPWKRFAAALVAAAFAVLGASPAAAAGWKANDDDALLFQLHVKQYQLDGDIRGYRTDRGICVDLGDIIQALDLPVRLDTKSRRATGWLFAESQTFTIDRDSNTVQIVNKRNTLAPGEIYDTPEGWCVDAKSLSAWFGAQFTPDPYNLILKLDSQQPLPFMEALERRSRAARLHKKVEFDLSQLPQADLPYKALRAPSADVVVNFRLDQYAGGRAQRTSSYEIYASGEVAGASVDARFASDPSGAPQSLQLEAYRYDPKGGLLGPLHATKVAIGDVETETGTLAGLSGIGRGATISNKPAQQPASFSTTTIRGAMPTGWDAELYRNGQLIAFQGDSADGRYEFDDVELYFGNNDFEVVLYGPQGQIRRETSSVPVGTQSIKPGQTYYWAGVIEEGRDLLEFGREIVDPNTGWRWGVGVEHGIDDRMMLAANAQSLVVRGTRHTYLETNLRRAVGPALVELSASQSLGRGRAYQAQALGKIGKVNFTAETFWIDGAYESDVIEPQMRGETRLGMDTTLKLGRTVVPVQLQARRELDRDGSKVNEWLIRGSLNIPKVSFTAELGELWTEKPYGPPATNDGMRVNLLANTRIGKANVRGELEYRLTGPDKGLQTASVVGEIPLGERSDLRAELAYQLSYHRTDFDVGYVRTFDRFALQADGRISSDGTIGAGVSLAFSIGPNPANGGVRFSSEKLARTGETAVTVFRDDNGDGVLSPGEQPLSGVQVEAGYVESKQPTDKNGHTIIEGMKPFVPVLVSIDTGSLPDPYLQPQGKGIVVTPRPGIAASIALPLSPTGEIEGTVHDLSGAPRGGVQLELVDAKGDVAATAATEYDGYFLFEAVPYGRYALRLAGSSAKALAAARGLANDLVLSHDKDVQRLGIVRLKPDGIARSDRPVAEGKS